MNFSGMRRLQCILNIVSNLDSGAEFANPCDLGPFEFTFLLIKNLHLIKMEGQLVENPDGTPAVVVPVDSKGTSKITNQPQMQLMPDPWKQQDATALNELARMRKQDAADRTDLSAEVRTVSGFQVVLSVLYSERQFLI